MERKTIWATSFSNLRRRSAFSVAGWRFGPAGSQNALATGPSTSATVTIHGLCGSSSSARNFLSSHSTLASFVRAPRSEEHTSELQSLRHLVCRLLLEKKKKKKDKRNTPPANQHNTHRQRDVQHI